MPDAETQTAHTRPLSELTIKNYTLAFKRIEDAKLDLDNPKEVLDWITSKGGDSAQMMYLSALKWKGYTNPVYQAHMQSIFDKKNKKGEEQELTAKQKENFVTHKQLLTIQKKLAEKEDKSDRDWKNYVVASLYTLQPPVRADYGDMRVFKKRLDDRKGNELIWGQKKGNYFVFRDYKTSAKYGTVEIKVSPALNEVLTAWFEHLGRVPGFLLARSHTPDALMGEIQDAFRSTKKTIGVNLLRHAYITDFFKEPRTIKEKETLSVMMLHSREIQETYIVASELKAKGDDADTK